MNVFGVACWSEIIGKYKNGKLINGEHRLDTKAT
jgi:hypothetical protein